MQPPEVLIPLSNEVVVIDSKTLSPKQYVDIALVTLDEYIIGELRKLNAATHAVPLEHDWMQTAKEAATDTVTYTEALIRIARAAQDGKPVDVIRRPDRDFFYTGGPLTPKQIEDLGIETIIFDPKKRLHQSRIAGLVSQTIQDRVRQDLSSVRGYVELVGVRIDKRLMSQIQPIMTLSDSINLDLTQIESAQEKVFSRKSVPVYEWKGQQFLVSPRPKVTHQYTTPKPKHR